MNPTRFQCQTEIVLTENEQELKQCKQLQTLFFTVPKSLQMVSAAMKLKDVYFLEEKL